MSKKPQKARTSGGVLDTSGEYALRILHLIAHDVL